MKTFIIVAGIVAFIVYFGYTQAFVSQPPRPAYLDNYDSKKCLQINDSDVAVPLFDSAEALYSGDLYLYHIIDSVESRTECLIIKTNGFLEPACLVRIMSGEHFGEVGWVKGTWIQYK